MKKITVLLITAAVILGLALFGFLLWFFSGFEGAEPEPVKLPTGISTVQTKLDVNYDSLDEGYRRDVFLTENKFIFTSYYSQSSFGSNEKPYVYNLVTGEITPLVDFDLGDFEIKAVVNDTMYFSCRAKSEYKMKDCNDYYSGVCFCSYNLSNGKYEKLIQTACDGYVEIAVIDDSVIYAIKTSDYDWSVYLLKDGKNTLLDDTIISRFAKLAKRDNGALLYLYTPNDEYPDRKFQVDIMFIDKDGNIKSDNLPDEYYDTEGVEFFSYSDDNGKNAPRLDDKIISGDFGRYLILEDPIPPEPEGENEEGNCGYEYSINYYLYDTETEETTPLTEATYWYYYI